MKTNKPQLTISLLISNRLDTIPRCLDSLRLLMDKISCELILIDTSKNPEVHKLLLTYTDQVYEFEWCNDFAKARNEGLKRANGEWFLYLDDDEWFAEADEIIEFFKSGEYKEYAYANFMVRNFLDEEYMHYNDCWATRMVRLDGKVRFISKIHEYFAPVNGKRKDLYALANHSGYIFDTPEKRRAHFERNYPLIKEMIKEEPTNIRWRLQLAQEYSSACEWEDLVKFCDECILWLKHEDTEFLRNNIGTFYAGWTQGLIRQKKYAEAIDVCKKALADKRSREVLKAMMYLRLAESYLQQNLLDETIKNIENYLAILHSVNRKSEYIREQEFGILVGEALDASNQKIAYNILVCCQLEKGNIETLIENYEKLCWNEKIICSIEDVEKYMVRAMWKLPYHPIFTRVMLDVFRNKDFKVHFRKEILSEERECTNDFQICLYDLAKYMQELVDGPQENDLIRYHQSLQFYLQSVVQWCDFVEGREGFNIQEQGIPGYLQAAMDIGDYLELESADTIQALGRLKDAVEVLPDIADGVGRFIHNYSELENQRMKNQHAEMEALRVQVIGQVKAMLAAGQKEAAIQIIGQLRQMFPEDREVAELILDVMK